VGLERGPLSLVSTTEELLERKSSGSDQQNRDYGRRESAALTMGHPSSYKKLALTSPTSGGRSVGIVRSRTKPTELLVYYYVPEHYIILNARMSVVIVYFKKLIHRLSEGAVVTLRGA
jgi:hypothetical protein